MAGVTSVGMASEVDVAPVLAAAALVYVGAAALGRPAAAWPLFAATAVVITAALVTDAALVATWAILGAGLLLVGAGFATGARRPVHGLPVQSLALLGFGGLAALGLVMDATAGSYLVAAGLLGHAAWDAHHLRTRRVVVRSLALFCLVLDAALGVVIALLTALA